MHPSWHPESKRIKSENYSFGCQAEQLVINYLIKNGLKILYNRWKSPYGEIDIIAGMENLIVFVEVKARKVFFEQEIVSLRQQKRNSAAALYFLSLNEQYSRYELRYDCAMVSKKLALEYIKNAWYIE